MQISDPVLECDLTTRLLGLNYHAFLRCVGILLERIGYRDVALTGRTGWVGRNKDGGCDLTALLPVLLPGGGARRVIVQAKQYAPERRIYQRTVDELRGVCLRAGVAEAVLITTGAFSETLDKERLASLPLLPVRLIDGQQLISLMTVYKVGVWEEAPEEPHLPPRRGIDEEFFREMEDAFDGVARPTQEERIQLDFSITISPRKRRHRREGEPATRVAKNGRCEKRCENANTKKAAVPRMRTPENAPARNCRAIPQQ